MAKFKKGDHVVKKWHTDKIQKVEKSEYFTHEAFTYRYLKIEGCDKPQNEDDYILVGSFEESFRYAMKGIFYAILGTVIILAAGLLVYRFCQFINL